MAQQSLPLARQLITVFLRGANNVERTPTEHACHGVKVRGVYVATEPSRLKRYLAGAAEGVGQSRTVAVTHDAQLLDEFRERLCARAEVSIDGGPHVVVDRVHNLFRTPRLVNSLPVRCFGEHLGLDVASFLFSDVRPPRDLHFAIVRVRPVNWRKRRQYSRRVRDEVVRDVGNGDDAENLLWLWSSLPADDERLVVHGHDLLEYLQIACLVICGRKQAP